MLISPEYFLVRTGGRYSSTACNKGIKVNQSQYRSEVPRGFQKVNVPRLDDSGLGWW